MERYSLFMKTMIKIFNISERDRYGRAHVISFAQKYLENKEEAVVVDIAAGSGTDLINIKENVSCNVKLYGLEAYEPNVEKLKKNEIETFQVDIEKEKLPFEDESVDIVVANQILEHCKELWWILSEISRVLKKDGAIIIGVPNLASLHCRALLLFGKQPTCIEAHGPHIRGFCYKDFKFLIESDGYFNVIDRKGSGFYSLIPCFTNFLAKIFPNAAVCMTLFVKRTKKEGLFIEQLSRYRYETNYYAGDNNTTNFKVK